MKLNMIGTGYVGLVTGACFAEQEDNHVICTDIDEKKINDLKEGKIPIYEKGLESLVKDGLRRGNLEFTTDLNYAVENSLVNFICVGTPSEEDGSANLRYVEEVARGIGRAMNEYKVIVNKSTVPLGTSRLVEGWVLEELTKRKKTRLPFDVVSCPEFLAEGKAIENFSTPDRVVIGTNSERAKQIMVELFRPYCMNRKAMVMKPQDAELVKYLSNGMLSTKVDYVNEGSRIADAYSEQTGDCIDILKVLEAVCADSRIGSTFMKPGPGYGGSCFPKDTRELAHLANRLGLDLPIIGNINNSNEMHKDYLLDKILREYGKRDMPDTTITVWGLAFKANTDDIRESAAIYFIEGLLDYKAKIRCYDPEAMEQTKKIFGDSIFYAKDKYEAAEGADGLIIATEWKDFRTPNFEKLKEIMAQPTIFDYRNLYGQQSPELEKRIRELGFEYYGVGR